MKLLSRVFVVSLMLSAGAANAERSGEEIVAKHCNSCHGTPGLPVAPRSAEEWQAFTSAKSVDEMVAVTVKGVKAMPPKGACFDCSETELKAAIEVLLP
jgi:cytochrome c5